MPRKVLTPLEFNNQTTPTNPPAGSLRVYAKTDKLYQLTSAGVETDLSATGGGAGAPWRGKLHALWGDGNPAQQDILWAFQSSAVSVAGPTPTAIATTIGRLTMFRFEQAITVVNIRYFGVAATTNLYTMAVYSGTTRLWTATISTAAAAWTSIAASFTIPADTQCWFGLGAAVVGTVAGFRSPTAPITSSLGIVMPGSLNTYGMRYAQVALTAGAWPVTLPAIATAAFASGGTSGTLPVVFADFA